MYINIFNIYSFMFIPIPKFDFHKFFTIFYKFFTIFYKFFTIFYKFFLLLFFLYFDLSE
jgi:hypothetical protein